jgi:hypothetical protein
MFSTGCTKPTGLQNRSATVSPHDRRTDTNLVTAAVSGDLPKVKTLIAAGANPNAQDSSGRPALMLAVEWDNADCAQALISAGADPTLKNKDGQSAADYAEAFSDLKGSLHGADGNRATPVRSDAPVAKRGSSSKASAAETSAWKKLNGMDLASLEKFIAAFPVGAHRNEVMTYIVMQKRMADVRAGDTHALKHLLTNTQLGADWAPKWDKEAASGGVFLSSDATSAGIYNPVGGGATPKSTTVQDTNISLGDGTGEGGAVLAMLDLGADWKAIAKQNKPFYLDIWPRTGDGAIMGFESQGHKIGIFGWTVETGTENPLVFGVVKNFGIVHLAGSGKVTLKNGTVVTFK